MRARPQSLYDDMPPLEDPEDPLPKEQLAAVIKKQAGERKTARQPKTEDDMAPEGGLDDDGGDDAPPAARPLVGGQEGVNSITGDVRWAEPAKTARSADQNSGDAYRRTAETVLAAAKAAAVSDPEPEEPEPQDLDIGDVGDDDAEDPDDLDELD
jgi:hypothetical protein